MNMEKAAVKYFKDSLKIAQNRYGSKHEVVASVMYDIGSIHDCKGVPGGNIMVYTFSPSVRSCLWPYIMQRIIRHISQR